MASADMRCTPHWRRRSCMKVHGGMTEVLWWHSTRAGTAYRQIRHSSHSSANPQRRLRADNRKGNLTMAGDPRLRWTDISTLRQSNNCQEIVALVRGVSVRSGTPQSCCGSIDRNQLYPGCSSSPISNPSLDLRAGYLCSLHDIHSEHILLPVVLRLSPS
jgi:hypothetical protein